MGKHPKTSSSSKWRLGENVVLRLLGCLSFDIFIMNNYFTSFRLLTHIGVNNIRAARVLNKNRLRKCTINGEKHLQKKGTLHFEQFTSSKKAV